MESCENSLGLMESLPQATCVQFSGYFEIIIDLHAVVRNNTEKLHARFPNGNILQTYSTVQERRIEANFKDCVKL